MTLTFPESFFFGTSTSAAQIETAFQHDWQGLRALDGSIFDSTTAHETRFDQDAEIIRYLGTDYRFSLMWSKLQRAPLAPLDRETTVAYHRLLDLLKAKDVRLMMVLHHWVNPAWFAESGGWSNPKNISVWVDYAKKIIDEFGHKIDLWNTFNEPNLYVTLAYAAGLFPPFARNAFQATRAIGNMSQAHKIVYEYLKHRFPDKLVGVSHNYVSFHAENLSGAIPARIAKAWYRDYLGGFFNDSDFTGLSYYARIGFNPLPVTQIYTPGKIRDQGKRHDDIWEYYPDGLQEGIRYFFDRFKKPVIITENGFCTSDDAKRVAAIRDYAVILHRALDEQYPILGYYHWTAWDNFEWTLGMNYKFGLFSFDPVSLTRQPKPSASVYAQLAHRKFINLEGEAT